MKLSAVSIDGVYLTSIDTFDAWITVEQTHLTFLSSSS
jgi:hypothetical protein